MKTKLMLAVALLGLICNSLVAQQDTQSETPAALNFTMQTLAGEDVDLSKYEGKVVLFVNVASKCGLTPQYEQLQALHEAHAEDGLAVVGVPCNQFGGQEPGSADEITEFCQENYGVEFDMLAKVNVNGDEQCDLYKYLTSVETEPQGPGKIAWNFEKFVVNRSGEVIGRFGPRVRPDADELVSVLTAALAEGGDEGGMPYAHRSEKLDREYYLFCKEVQLKNSEKTQTIYFFTKDPESDSGTPLTAVPETHMVSETKTGMLVLKKKN